jgi:hypothetical protein
VVGKVVATLAVWAYAGVGCILMIADTHLGPTLYSFDDYHGVHLGDLVSLVAFPAGAFVVSRSFWRRPRA